MCQASEGQLGAQRPRQRQHPLPQGARGGLHDPRAGPAWVLMRRPMMGQNLRPWHVPVARPCSSRRAHDSSPSQPGQIVLRPEAPGVAHEPKALLTEDAMGDPEELAIAAWASCTACRSCSSTASSRLTPASRRRSTRHPPRDRDPPARLGARADAAVAPRLPAAPAFGQPFLAPAARGARLRRVARPALPGVPGHGRPQSRLTRDVDFFAARRPGASSQ